MSYLCVHVLRLSAVRTGAIGDVIVAPSQASLSSRTVERGFCVFSSEDIRITFPARVLGALEEQKIRKAYYSAHVNVRLQGTVGSVPMDFTLPVPIVFGFRKNLSMSTQVRQCMESCQSAYDGLPPAVKTLLGFTVSVVRAQFGL